MKDYIKNTMAIIGIALMITGICCVPFCGAKLIQDYNCSQIGKQINAAKRMLCKLSRPVD